MYFCNVDSAGSAAGGQFIYMGWSFVFLYTSFRLFSSRIHTSVTIFPLGRVYQSFKNVSPRVGESPPLYTSSIRRRTLSVRWIIYYTLMYYFVFLRFVIEQ